MFHPDSRSFTRSTPRASVSSSNAPRAEIESIVDARARTRDRIVPSSRLVVVDRVATRRPVDASAVVVVIGIVIFNVVARRALDRARVRATAGARVVIVVVVARMPATVVAARRLFVPTWTWTRDYSRHFASRSTNDDRLANDPRTMERATTRCANALAMRRTCASMRASAKSARRATTKPARAGTIRCGAVQKMNAEELEIAMANRDRPMVIDFYATWCGPCVLMSSELEKVQEQLGDKVQCVKVDTDEESDLATQLQIQGLPTLVFVSTDSSKPALRTEGMLPAETVISVIENEL